MPAKLHYLKSSLDTAVRDLVADETGVGVVEIILIMIGIHTTQLPIVLC